MPSTTHCFTKTGDQVSVSEGVLSSFPCPEPLKETTLCPLLPYEPLSSKLRFPDSARVCSKRDQGVKQLCGSCLLCLFFSPSSLLPPLFLSFPLSKPFYTAVEQAPWIKTLSKTPLFKVISNFSARLSEICLFEGRIRCDRRMLFIVT